MITNVLISEFATVICLCQPAHFSLSLKCTMHVALVGIICCWQLTVNGQNDHCGIIMILILCHDPDPAHHCPMGIVVGVWWGCPGNQASCPPTNYPALHWSALLQPTTFYCPSLEWTEKNLHCPPTNYPLLHSSAPLQPTALHCPSLEWTEKIDLHCPVSNYPLLCCTLHCPARNHPVLYTRVPFCRRTVLHWLKGTLAALKCPARNHLAPWNHGWLHW